MFNPNPRIDTVPIGEGHLAHVIDDALREPARWVDYAVKHADGFRDAPHNGFPGPELRMPDAISSRLDEFFAQHVRRNLGARRTVRMYSRLSMVVRAPDALMPWQWIPHTDRLDADPAHSAIASMLYLFTDPALGGTSFYRPLRPAHETLRLVQDSMSMDGREFFLHHGVAPGYPVDNTDWFEKTATIPARWNRLVFYSGCVFHSGEITTPSRLVADPLHGRLTLNGFWTCRRAAE